MARLVYACRFELPEAGALGYIVAPAYQDWIADRYAAAFDTDVALDLLSGTVLGSLPPEHSVQVEKFETTEVALRIDWAFPGDHGLVWHNTVRMAELNDSCVVEHQVQLGSADYLVAPAFFSVGAPSVVRTICERNRVCVGDMQLMAAVYPLALEGVDDFLELLRSPLRRLPVILVTPFANGDHNEIRATELASKLAGVAVVAEADTPDTTRALSEKIGRFGCYDGAVRTYWPGFSLEDDLRRHPLLFGSRIAIMGAARAAHALQRSIFSVAAFRFVPDVRIDAIITAFEAARRAERAASALEAGDATWEKYALEISADLDTAKTQIIELKAENANLRENQKLLFAFADEEQTEEGLTQEARSPNSVLQAVEYAKTDFPNLIFLESSEEAARGSPFKRPTEVYEALSVMDKVASVWKRNRGGGDLRQMLIDAGLGRRVSSFISQTAKGKWGHEYTFVYDGERKVFAPHVTLGAGAADTCASIHFLPDDTKGKLVIAHVGRHLSNTKT